MNHRLGLRVPRRRRDATVVGLLLLATVAMLWPGIPVDARSQAPPKLGEFVWGLAGQESGWDYTARNRSSGAYGRYQIMPANWPSWARRYVGDPWADQTPRNQELVARAKIVDLQAWLGSWRRVAYWWLTGDTETDERKWSDTARRYVNNITTLAKRAPKGGDPIPEDPAEAGPPAARGDWRMANVGTMLYDRVSGQRRVVAKVRDGEVLFVQAARWNQRDVLWMRVSTADDEVGWISIRRTLPARKPTDSQRWPRGDGSGDPDPKDGRKRARPRPH